MARPCKVRVRQMTAEGCGLEDCRLVRGEEGNLHLAGRKVGRKEGRREERKEAGWKERSQSVNRY